MTVSILLCFFTILRAFRRAVSAHSPLLNGVYQFMRGNTRFKPASAEIYIVPLRIGSGTEIFIFPDAVRTAVEMYRGKIGPSRLPISLRTESGVPEVIPAERRSASSSAEESRGSSISLMMLLGVPEERICSDSIWLLGEPKDGSPCLYSSAGC